MVYSDITLDMVNHYATYKLDPTPAYTFNSFAARISADVAAFMSPKKSTDSVYDQAAGLLSGMGIGIAPKQGAALPSDVPAMAAGRAKLQFIG